MARFTYKSTGVQSLPAFDHAEWTKGLKFDLSSKAWGGKGWEPVTLKNGEKAFTRDKKRILRIKKDVAVKAEQVIKPSIGLLTSEFDNEGRCLSDLRGMVDHYGALYDASKDIFDCSPRFVESKLEQKTLESERKNLPWRDSRHSATTDNDGLKLLMEVFKAIHDSTPETDD
jgi:hypothetical protein